MDVTDSVGIDFIHDPGLDGSYYFPESMGSGCAFFDYDNDGYQDIYLINMHNHDGSQKFEDWSQNELYRQKPDGTFENVTQQSGLGDKGYGMGVAIGDIDNDGDLDAYLTNYEADQLYLNQGDGTFKNITKEAGIKNDKWGSSATFVDYNLDGYLDIFIVNYVRVNTSFLCSDRSGRPEYCGPKTYPGVADVLYKNNGDGTFTDISLASKIGLPEKRGLGVVTSDFNDDGYPDIYVSNDAESNLLWINQKDGTFTDIATQFGAAVNRFGAREAGMGIAVGDANGDLMNDIFVAHLTGESNTLYLNHGKIGFEDISQTAGLEGMEMISMTSFGVGFVDLDLDSRLDLVVGNGHVERQMGLYYEGEKFWQAYSQENAVFKGLGGGKFKNISAQHPQFSGPVETTKGVAFADYDNDGDMDVLLSNTGGKARLYRNDQQTGRNWLSLTLFDPKLNRIAVGARVIITAGTTRLAGEAMPGYSYQCSNDFRVHFGLGEISTIEEALVHWPGGGVEKFTNLQSSQHVTLTKGSGHDVVQ